VRAGFAAALVLLAPSARAELLAVVVGSNAGSELLPTLRYADDDALKLAALLRQLDPAATVEVLVRPDDDTRVRLSGTPFWEAGVHPPKKLEVRQALARLAGLGRPDATLLFFYAGHGQTGSLLLEGGEQLSGHELKAWLAQVPAARRFAFIDACRAQSLFSERGGFAEAISAADDEAASAPLASITAATSQSPAGENELLKAGYFSHVLTSGLAGAADVDQDRVVRFDELAAFVTLHTQRFSATRPWFEAPEGMLQAPVVSLGTARQGLQWRAGLIGRQVVRTRDELLIAEAHPGQAPGLLLALPPGLYTLEDWSSTPPASSSIEVHAGAFTLADGLSPAPSQRGSEYPTGESGFEAPFTAAAVRSWATAYSAGQTGTPRRGTRLAVDFGFAPSSGGFVGAFSWGLAAGLAARLQRFEVGAVLDGQLADTAAGAERHLGLLARGAWAVADFGLFTPRVDLLAGLRLWHFTAPDGRTGVDWTVPTLGAQLSVDVLLGAGFRASLGVRAELAFPSVDSGRSAYGAVVGLLGVRWLSPAG
jgi:hypothetical protein